MSIVGDLREALQDIVALDLKAVVRGLADLKEEVRNNAILLRDELAVSEERGRERMHELDKGSREALDQRARERMEELDKGSRDRTETSERRILERLDRVYDAVKISDLTRRNTEPQIELEQLRKAPQH